MSCSEADAVPGGNPFPMLLCPQWSNPHSACLSSRPPAWAELSAPFALTRKVKRVMTPSHRRFMVGKKLYVGNLSYSVTSSDLGAVVRPVRHGAEVRRSFKTATPAAARASALSKWATMRKPKRRFSGLHDQEHDGRPLDRQRSPSARRAWRRRWWWRRRWRRWRGRVAAAVVVTVVAAAAVAAAAATK